MATDSPPASPAPPALPALPAQPRQQRARAPAGLANSGAGAGFGPGGIYDTEREAEWMRKGLPRYLYQNGSGYKIYVARNGAHYIKLPNGQCRFISKYY